MLKIFRAFKKQSDAAPAEKTPVAAPLTDDYWARRRAPQFSSLSGWTRNWLQALPEAVRPIELSVQHPHVANRLALSWRDAAVTAQVFDDLLVGKRKQRKGFASAVAAELQRLREFHQHGRVAPVDEPALLDGTAPPPDGASTDSSWAQLRAPLRASDLVLSITAQDWLESLPAPLRPARLCMSYPRVVNRLALCWSDPASTSELLEDLLIGKRGNRKGFPGPVAEELMRLRRFHDSCRKVEVDESVRAFPNLAVSDR
jgi:hypothetical protein